MDPSLPFQDAPCPYCGCLLHFKPLDVRSKTNDMLMAFLKSPLIVQLKVMQGTTAGRDIEIPSPKCLIGRERGCDLKVNSETISRRHCLIITTKKEVVVRDLKSRNGTFVNDIQVVDEVVAANGDVLRVGSKHFEMQIRRR